MNGTHIDPTTVHLNDHSAAAASALPWLNPFWKAFGPRGLVALAYWTGSLMAQELRERQRNFPILAIIGEEDGHAAPMLEALNAIIGRPAYEGWSPAMATRKEQALRLYGVQNRPVVCIASRGPYVRGLVREEIAAAYAGTPVCVRSHALDHAPITHRFAGALVLSQHISVMRDPAMAMRCCEITLNRAEETGDARAARHEVDRLQAGMGANAARFIDFIDSCRAEALELHTRLAPQHHELLLGVAQHPRIARNHAQLAALVDVLHLALQLSEPQRLAALDVVASMALAAGQAVTVQQPASI